MVAHYVSIINATELPLTMVWKVIVCYITTVKNFTVRLFCTAMIRRNYWHTKQSEWISKTMWTERRQIEGHLEKGENTIQCDSGKILLAEVVGRQGLKTKGHNRALRVRKMFYILFRVGVAWLFTLVKTPLNHTPKKNSFFNGTPLQYSCLENPVDRAW